MKRSTDAPAERTRHVVMLLQWYSHLHHRGIARYAKEANWSLNATDSHAWDSDLTPRVESAIRHADGVIGVFGWPTAVLDFIRRRHVPVVDLCNALPTIHLPRVLPDNEGLGAAVAAHFLDRGFRQFAFWPVSDDWCAVERLRGFSGALRSRGFDCHPLAVPVTPGEDPSTWLAARLRAIPKPLAVMAQNDDFAVMILDACRDAKIAVPDELALVGCDNDELVCNSARIPLSSADANLEGHAYEAARLLDQLMDGARPPRRPIRVAHKGVVIRQSSDVLAIEHPGLTRAIRSIGLNYADLSLSVERLAGEASMTRQRLDKACRQHLGRTVSEEIRRIRLAKAIALLRSGGGGRPKVAAIARQCGYSGAKHLRDTLLRATGSTPIRFWKGNKA
jgi:LacI family transcriptional regulator